MEGLNLPLHIFKPSPGIVWSHLIIEDAQNTEVAFLRFHGQEPEVRAKAEAIVLACNSHDELLEACRKALTSQASMNSDVVALLRAAIAKGE